MNKHGPISIYMDPYRSMLTYMNPHWLILVIWLHISLYGLIKANIGEYRSILVDFDRCKPILDYIGQYLTIQIDIGDCWPILINIGQHCSILVYVFDIGLYREISSFINQY